MGIGKVTFKEFLFLTNKRVSNFSITVYRTRVMNNFTYLLTCLVPVRTVTVIFGTHTPEDENKTA